MIETLFIYNLYALPLILGKKNAYAQLLMLPSSANAAIPTSII